MAEEIINPEEEVQLINEEIMQYLEASLDILDTSDLMITNYSVVINDDKKLKAFAAEYRLISIIRRQKEQMKGKILDISRLMPALRQIILQIQSDKNAYRLVESDLAKIIRDFEILEKVLGMTKDVNEFRANTNIVLKDIEELSQEKLKVQIRNRILSIKNKLEESDALQIAITDLKNWDRLPHNEIEFYLTRVGSYFRPIIPSNFAGIDKFKDTELKRIVYASRPIRYLRAIAHLTYKAEAQKGFLASLIRNLEQDISGDVWVQDKSTKLFLDDVDSNAGTLVNNYKNVYLANMLRRQAREIGEQPFKLRDMLRQMIKIVEGAIGKKEYAIRSSQEFLVDVFRKRQDWLLTSAQNFIQEIFRESSKYIDDFLEKTIKKIERFVGRLWEARKRQLAQFIREIFDVHSKLEPIMKDIFEKGMIDRNTRLFMLKLKALNDFRIHKNILFQNLKTGKNIFPHLLMLDFDLARMRDLFYSLKKNEAEMKQKSEYLNSAVKYISGDMSTLINRNVGFVDFVISIKLNIEGIDLNKAREMFVAFAGVKNG
ncbi:hypothetical protein J4234_03450 [Candidatus Woesearchaeota archaeon]|nr:hypothetical protein [Candidatus Woesearchaeota archaeon]